VPGVENIFLVQSVVDASIDQAVAEANKWLKDKTSREVG
jgi:hypothetical protein